jgi:hypothetical protein
MEKNNIPPIQIMPEMRWTQKLRILKMSTPTPAHGLDRKETTEDL